MKLFKGLSKHDILYGGLISTFIVLYGATAFVSWYHAITFFNIANAMWLSVILSFVAEIGQASVLFSILLTELKKFSHVLLSWTVMVLLTTLQVIGNVVSSYEWITTHGGAGVEAFQKSILFWMAAADPEIFKVVIAWITGALLPIIALSMTALVAQYMELKAEKVKTHLDVDEPKLPTPEPIVTAPEPIVPAPEPIPADVIVSEVSKIRLSDEELNELAELLKNKRPIEKAPPEEPPIEEKKTSFSGSSPDEIEIKNPNEKITEIIGSTWGEEQEKMLSEFEGQQENRPNTSDEIHEEWNKMYDEINKDQEETPPPEQLTNQEVIPHYSDEEIREMFMDEWERKGTYNDTLDEDVEELTPELIKEEPKTEPSVEINNGLFEGLGTVTEIESPPLPPPLPSPPEIVDTGTPIPGYVSEPLPPTTPEQEEEKRQEEARIEKLRQIARDNLKKK